MPTRKTPGAEGMLSKHMDKLRVLTAAGGSAGLIAIVLFLANIQTQLDRNCDATAAVGAAVIGVVSVDDELGRTRNTPLRAQLIRSLHLSADSCKVKGK